MSDDAGHWNQDDDREEHDDGPQEQEEEEEEEEEQGRSHRRQYDDDDDDEDEDEDEEDEDEEEEDERRPKKKRRKAKRAINPFLDVEAAVDSDDEEESGDEGEDGFLEKEEGFEEVVGERSGIHQQLDRRQQELTDLDMENIAERITERYQRTGANRYTGDLTNIPQRLLMPSVNDANLWQVRVKPGKERDICFSLMRKAMDLEFSAHPLKILSAFQRDNLPGMIYVEARSQVQVQQSLNGLVGVFPSRGITLVPIEEMAPLLTYRKKENKIVPGAWVRIKRGKYAGDLAQVVDITENGEEVGLRFIPRIDMNPKDDVAGLDGKKRKKGAAGLSVNTRPPQRFFNVEEIIKVYGRKSVAHRPKTNSYVFQNDTFKFGYIEKDIRVTGIQTEDVNPTLDEITKFMKQQDGDDNAAPVDLSVIADASRKAAIVVLQPGDHVEVFEGEQTGVHGIVKSINDDIVTMAAEGLDLEGGTVEIEVPARSVRKKFKPGDHVKVMAGKNVDETGLVVSVEDNVVTFLSDMSLQEVSVFSKDLRTAAEVGASTNVVGNYELHDLVQLDTQTVGVIFKTERDSFRVLDQNGQVRVVQPHQINMGRDSRKAIATDATGHELRVGDNVKEIDGEGRKGQVLHIHQSFFAFLHNREIAENGGVFVTRARSLTSLAPKNVIKPGSNPDLSKMNPAVGSAPAGGFVGSGARGPRDRLIGVHVIVTKGTFKGYIGIIKDTNGNQCRVELNTGNKIITIDKDKLMRQAKGGAGTEPLEFPMRGRMAPPAFPPSRTPNPYVDASGSKTPGMGFPTGRTPNPYTTGSATPSWGISGRTPGWNSSGRTPNPYEMSGGKTPAWNASARTPNPYADGGRTPAWNASARTPNPYASGSGSLGGATPARSGWGGTTPGRSTWGSADTGEDSWSQPSDFSAPTPGAAFSAPTPGAMGAPTPGPSAMSAPTPGAFGAPTPGAFSAPTPGVFSAPTPSFPKTPGVAATPFVPGNYGDIESETRVFEPDQETWLLDPIVRKHGLVVQFKARKGGNFDWHDGAYDGAIGRLIAVTQVGSEYTTTAQVSVDQLPPSRPDLPTDVAAVPVYHLAPVPPERVGDMAIPLRGELKGKETRVIEADATEFLVSPVDQSAGVTAFKRKELCKWKDPSI